MSLTLFLTNFVRDDDEITWRPTIGRFPMSMWKGVDFTGAGEQENSGNYVDVFYTEVPRTIQAPAQDDDVSQEKSGYSKEKWSVGPQRIVIHSEEMLQELRQTTKVLLRGSTIAMIPPFKLLIRNQDAIKSKLVELRQHAAAGHASTPSPAVGMSTRNDSATKNSLSDIQDKPTVAYSRADRLRCIHDLMQTDLANYIGLDGMVGNGDLDEVLFEEVYHIFKPGDLILSAESGDDQVYQVFSVTGGRMRLSKPRPDNGMPRSMNQAALGNAPGTWTDLIINSFIMAWDGEDIGPLQFNHVLPYFAGERRVADLEVYPIQFHKDPDGLLNRLRARGRKVVECFGHKQYTGTSVQSSKLLAKFGMMGNVAEPDSDSDSEEEESGLRVQSDMVRSDIYVDYKPSYTSFFATNFLLSHLSRHTSPESETTEVLDNGQTQNYADQEVDIHLSDKFLSSHRHLTTFSKPKDDLSDDHDRLQLLSGHVPGFIFSTRKWSTCDQD